MAILCGLLPPAFCRRVRSELSGMSKKGEAKAEHHDLIISGPFNTTHVLHISKDDVACAMAATGGHIETIEDITKWRSKAMSLNIKTQDEDMAGKDLHEGSSKEVSVVSTRGIDEISGEEANAVSNREADAPANGVQLYDTYDENDSAIDVNWI